MCFRKYQQISANSAGFYLGFFVGMGEVDPEKFCRPSRGSRGMLLLEKFKKI